MKTKALAREDRLHQILLCFAVEIQDGRDGKMTVADIARKLRLTPSTKLRLMVGELEMSGQLISEKEAIPGIAKFRRIYRPDPKRFPRPNSREGRSIKITSNQINIFVEEQSYIDILNRLNAQ